MKRAASAFAALAASCTPALAHVAPWSSPDPPPPPVQFLIGIALMAVAGAVILWQGAALARGRERRRFPVMRIALTVPPDLSASRCKARSRLLTWQVDNAPSVLRRHRQLRELNRAAAQRLRSRPRSVAAGYPSR